MLPSDTFRNLLSHTAATLRPYGYIRKGQNYYLQQEANWGIVNFQKSTKSSASTILFTINLGTASGRLFEFFSPGRFSVERPKEWDCHWRTRIGGLLPERQDIWWTITEDTIIEELDAIVGTHLTDLVIPRIESRIQDKQLRDLWLSGECPGLTPLRCLENLSVLVKHLGPQELLESILQELRDVAGPRRASIVESHVQRLSTREL